MAVCGVEVDIRPYKLQLRGKSNRDVVLALLAIARGKYPLRSEPAPELRPLFEAFDALPGTEKEKVARIVEKRVEFLVESVGESVPVENLPQEMKVLGELVAFLRKIGTKCGIASASPGDFVRTVIRRKETSDIFPLDFVIGSEIIEKQEEERPGERLAKPHPFSVLLSAGKAREAMSSPCHLVAYIGDSDEDCGVIPNASEEDMPIVGFIIPSSKETRMELPRKYRGHHGLTFLNTLADLVR